MFITHFISAMWLMSLGFALVGPVHLRPTRRWPSLQAAVLQPDLRVRIGSFESSSASSQPSRTVLLGSFGKKNISNTSKVSTWTGEN
jgi:hypothetical protein